MRVFVTGADGFIGSHLVDHLISKSYEVVALAQYNSLGSAGWLDDIKNKGSEHLNIQFGDVRDYDSLEVAASQCEAIIHLASLIAIPYSYRAPSSYLETNVRGTLNVLRLAQELGVARLVHTSTSEVYGTAQYVPIDESHPLVGQSPYSASKIAADQLAWSFWTSFQLPLTILRPFNTYGPRQSTRAVIPSIIRQALSGSSSIQLGKVSTTRDFTFVEDTVQAFSLALEIPESIGETINLGTGYEISIQGLLDMIQECIGTELQLEEKASRFRPPLSEVERLVSDNNKAKNLLGWSPRIGDRDGLIEGIQRTIDWWRHSNRAIYTDASEFVL